MMKKLFPTLILATTISTVHAEPINEAQLIGRWQCTTEYPQREVTITTNDTLPYTLTTALTTTAPTISA